MPKKIRAAAPSAIHKPFGETAPYTHGKVAVGTIIADHPPHRSGRAVFPHPAPTSGPLQSLKAR